MRARQCGSAVAVWCALACACAELQWPSCPPAARCIKTTDNNRENHYIVEGNKLTVRIEKGFDVTCENTSLESKSAPQFLVPTDFSEVTIRNCPAPVASYGAVLAALNITVLRELGIDSPAGGASLYSQHLTGLALDTLRIHNKPSPSSLNVTEDFLTAVNNLETLILKNVYLPPSTSIKLTNTLKTLYMRDSWPQPVRLESLEELRVHETIEKDFKIKLKKIMECKSLKTLVLTGLLRRKISNTSKFINSLPDEWLINCHNLTELSLWYLHLGMIPARLLHRENSLQKLTVVSCRIIDLSFESFENMNHLRVLDLSINLLTHLPSGIFSTLRSLEHLNLTKNRLVSLGNSLSPLTKLKQLTLTKNYLGDLCDTAKDNGLSVLSNLSALESLVLKRTNLTRLCADWRLNMPLLEELDVTYNKISVLKYKDLLFPGKKAIHVNITGNPIRQFMFEKGHYEDAMSRKGRELITESKQVTMEFNAQIQCDCQSYWFARMQCLRSGSPPAGVARVLGVRCRNGPALCDATPNVMTCRIKACAPHCTCELRVPDNATIATCTWPDDESIELPHSHPLVLHSENGNLTHLPRSSNVTELHVAWNRIRNLRPEDFTDKLRVLDLQHNEVSHVDADTVEALFAVRNRTVWLAGNPLACECEDSPLISALQLQWLQVVDYKDLRCADDRYVLDVDVKNLCNDNIKSATLPVIVAALLATGITVIAIAVVCARRAKYIKMFLIDCGIRPPYEESGKRYDVFVSFSYGDVEFVKYSLMPWFENRSRPYRVCVNYRDWELPNLIHTLITNSVHDSHCTIVVLSERYLSSEWERRTEFRTAQAAAMLNESRLVVILLCPASELLQHTLDEELRSYLDANTYLEWGDRWFWKKLQAALPPPTKAAKISARLLNHTSTSSQQPSPSFPVLSSPFPVDSPPSKFSPLPSSVTPPVFSSLYMSPSFSSLWSISTSSFPRIASLPNLPSSSAVSSSSTLLSSPETSSSSTIPPALAQLSSTDNLSPLGISFVSFSQPKTSLPLTTPLTPKPSASHEPFSPPAFSQRYEKLLPSEPSLPIVVSIPSTLSSSIAPFPPSTSPLTTIISLNTSLPPNKDSPVPSSTSLPCLHLSHKVTPLFHQEPCPGLRIGITIVITGFTSFESSQRFFPRLSYNPCLSYNPETVAMKTLTSSV